MVVSCLSEVTNFPLLQIFAYIDFGRIEFVLPPIVYEWGMEGETEVFRTSLNQMCFAAHVWCPPCWNGSEAAVSRLIEVTTYPYLEQRKSGRWTIRVMGG